MHLMNILKAQLYVAYKYVEEKKPPLDACISMYRLLNGP